MTQRLYVCDSGILLLKVLLGVLVKSTAVLEVLLKLMACVWGLG